MIALHKFQETLLHDIYEGTITSAPYLANGNGGYIARLNIYHNNLVLGVRDILQSFFPVVEKITGEGLFRTLAHDFMRAHPLQNGNRTVYGDKFADFLATHDLCREIPYLTDVARIEYAFHRAYDADDATVITSDVFAELLAQFNHGNIFLGLHPSVKIVTTHTNAFDIWQEHQKEDVDRVELQHQTEHILVWRQPDDDIVMCRIHAVTAQFFQSLHSGKSLEDVFAEVADFPDILPIVQQEFAQCLARGVFIQNQ